MAGEFKSLNMDKSKVVDCLNGYCKLHGIEKWEMKEVKRNYQRVNYFQGGDQVLLDIYYLSDGTTTLNHKVGKCPDKGIELAKYMRTTLVDDDRKSITVAVKSIDKGVFDLLLEYLDSLTNESDKKEISYSTEVDDDKLCKVRFVSSSYRDTMVVHFYKNTNSILIQGKPLYVYNQISYFLAKYADYNGFLEIIYKGETQEKNRVAIDEEAVDYKLKFYLPNSFDRVSPFVMKMLRTSITLAELAIPLPDYSCYVFPALRALEGFMRETFFKYGLSIGDNSNSFQGLFEKGTDSSFHLTADISSKIGDVETCIALEKCYDYFNKQRHGLFHANDFTGSSRIVEKKEDAAGMIHKIMRIIDDSAKEHLSDG